jgi:antitoxin component YwqK of YwqJK toxin-antitoxin module
MGWINLFQKENPVSISINEDGTLQLEGFVKGERLNVTLPEGAFSGSTGTVYHYGSNDTIPLAHYDDVGLKKDGSYQVNHENGMKAIEGTFKDGKMVGKWTYYNESGAKTRQMKYANGILKETIDCQENDCNSL